MPVLFLLNGPKMGFSPRKGRHVAPINVKFGTGGPLLRAKFHEVADRSSGRKCGNTALKTVKISNLARNFTPGATRLQCFYEILSICTRL